MLAFMAEDYMMATNCMMHAANTLMIGMVPKK